MITVYLGDVSEYLSQQARAADPDSQLITQQNYKDLAPGTYYTSLGDLGDITHLATVLRSADCVVYSPPPDNQWSDSKNGKSIMKTWLEDYLSVFSFYTQVENFAVESPDDKPEMLQLLDTRKTNDQQLWIAGCSFSHGTGVELDQRYGHLLSNQLNLPVSFLTTPGSSVVWAADQILRSDIRENDLVVWGVTTLPRIPHFYNGKLSNVRASTYTKQTPGHELDFDYFISEDVKYRSVVSMFQVINYCKKIKAKLLLVSMLDDGTLFNYIKDTDVDYLMLYQLWGRDQDQPWPDIAHDQQHPGPKTHEFYTAAILKKINQLRFLQ
jgi:hypothetical protein